MQLPFRLFLLLGCSALLFSCQKEISSKQNERTVSAAAAGKSNQDLKFNTFYGPQVQVGDGKARSFITISHTGVPSEIDIEMTSGALTGLPLHQKAQNATPFDHLVIN